MSAAALLDVILMLLSVFPFLFLKSARLTIAMQNWTNRLLQRQPSNLDTVSCHWALLCMLGLLAPLLAGCSGLQSKATTDKTAGNGSSATDGASKQTGVYQSGLMDENGEPAYITVQHCLIGFKGSVGNKPIARTKEEAEALAHKLFEQAKNGADFDKIVKEYTDDSPPGIYRMANAGHPADMSSRDPSKMVFQRSGMVPAFGNTGFPLSVGEVGLAEYSSIESPYGWHIIKRID